MAQAPRFRMRCRGRVLFVARCSVFELIRSRRLRERYALLWLLTGGVLLGLSIWRDSLNTIAGWFRVETYPPRDSRRHGGGLFILIVLLGCSTVISRLSNQNTILAGGRSVLRSSRGKAIADAGHVTVTGRSRRRRHRELVVQPVGGDTPIR